MDWVVPVGVELAVTGFVLNVAREEGGRRSI